MNTESKIIR